jgi:pimeloyl-ACP methyl ester carboxylesterase
MTSSTDELLPPGNDDLAIVFVHGFLDDRHTWDGVVNQLVTGVETIRVDLYGCGEQADASGPFSYDRLAAEVGAVVVTLQCRRPELPTERGCGRQRRARGS